MHGNSTKHPSQDVTFGDGASCLRSPRALLESYPIVWDRGITHIFKGREPLHSSVREVRSSLHGATSSNAKRHHLRLTSPFQAFKSDC